MGAIIFIIFNYGDVMLAELNLKKIYNRLMSIDVAKIHLGDSDILLQLFDHDSKMLLTSCVYNGGNFIPKSVRKAAAGNVPFGRGSIQSNIEIDENKSQITLSTFFQVVELDNIQFESSLREFGFQADEWRLLLDERDRNDLLPIFVK
jgi:hypothetical protein